MSDTSWLVLLAVDENFILMLSVDYATDFRVGQPHNPLAVNNCS